MPTTEIWRTRFIQGIFSEGTDDVCRKLIQALNSLFNNLIIGIPPYPAEGTQGCGGIPVFIKLELRDFLVFLYPDKPIISIGYIGFMMDLLSE